MFLGVGASSGGLGGIFGGLLKSLTALEDTDDDGETWGGGGRIDDSD